MIPITRIEKFLDGIVNGSDVPEPITRLEVMLNDIKNGDVVTLTPITRRECYLAKISGANVDIPTPITREETYLAKIAGVTIETPSPIVRIEHWLNDWANGGDILNTFTGKIISFFARNAKPFKSTKINIDPVQDLHGYEAPWPGGGGKNKLKPLASGGTTSGITATVNADGSVKLTGTASANVYFDVDNNFDSTALAGCIFNGLPEGYGSTNDVSYRVSNQGSRAALQDVVNGTTIADNGTGKVFSLRINNGTALPTDGIVIYPMIRQSGTDNTFAPYSNECPISGWTGATVYDNGVNQWDEQWEVGGLTARGTADNTVSDRIRSKNFIPVKPGTTYYYYIDNSTYGIWTWGYDKNKNFVGRVPDDAAHKNTTATIPDNIYYIKIVVQPGYGSTYLNDISINYPSTDHDYHAFSGQAVTLTFGQTVYGGTATDNGDGSWTVKVFPDYASYNGEPLVGPWLSSMDKYAAGTTPTTGAQVVDLGGTQTTFTVSGDTLETLVGVNTVWADTNGDLTVEVYGTPVA